MHSIDAMKLKTYRDLAAFVATLNDEQLNHDIVVMSSFDAHHINHAAITNDDIALYTDDSQFNE